MRPAVEPPPKWFREAISRGIQRLYTLSLQGSPAADILAGTSKAWSQGLWAKKAWDESLDAHRVEAGFVSLSTTASRWPIPADLLREMPPRPEAAALPPPAPDPERLAQELAALKVARERFLAARAELDQRRR